MKWKMNVDNVPSHEIHFKRGSRRRKLKWRVIGSKNCDDDYIVQKDG